MSWLVRAQADDFFEAYQVLTKCGAELNNPAVVNLAFALELYIKDIYFALKIEGKFPRGRDGHNILKLFERLPDEVRQEVFAHSAISQTPYTTRGNPFSPKQYSRAYTPYERFTDQIEDISNGFEKWRYSYENGTLKYESWFAEDLIKAFKSVAENARRRLAA